MKISLNVLGVAAASVFIWIGTGSPMTGAGVAVAMFTLLSNLSLPNATITHQYTTDADLRAGVFFFSHL